MQSIAFFTDRPNWPSGWHFFIVQWNGDPQPGTLSRQHIQVRKWSPILSVLFVGHRRLWLHSIVLNDLMASSVCLQRSLGVHNRITEILDWTLATSMSQSAVRTRIVAPLTSLSPGATGGAKETSAWFALDWRGKMCAGISESISKLLSGMFSKKRRVFATRVRITIHNIMHSKQQNEILKLSISY